jgi:CheY-like chemotaxis protein
MIIKRILVFDDDMNMLTILKYILEEKGWEVFTAERSNDAVEKINHFRPSVVLMDNKIPDYGGVITTQRIKGQPELRHIPVILMTANAEIETLAKLAGADGWLAKPFGLDSFYKIINRLLPES